MDIRPRQLLSDRAADLLLDARSSQVAHGHSLLAAPCRAYGAGNKTERGKALDSPAFRVLITAAGGRSTVDQFCQNVLAAPDASHTGDSTPSGRVHPTGPPTDPAGDHRTGKPT